MEDELPFERPMRATVTWSKLVIAGVAAVCCFAQVASILRLALPYVTTERAFVGHEAVLLAGVVAWLAGVVAWLVSAVLFLCWVHSAHTTARLLEPELSGLPTPGSAVVAYFIPFVNLVRPFRNMQLLARVSAPDDLEDLGERVVNESPGYRDAPVRVVTQPWTPKPAFVRAWWIGYVATNVLGAFAGIDSRFVIAQGAGFLVTGACAVAVVRAITRMQRERARRLSRLAEAGLMAEEDREASQRSRSRRGRPARRPR